MGMKKATIKVASIVTRSGGLFRLEVVVSDKGDKKAGRDDQEKDWK